MSDVEKKSNESGALKQFGLASQTRSRSTRGEVADDRSQDVLYWMFVALLIGITFFQKIGLVTGDGAIFPLIVPLSFIVIGVGLVYARPLIRVGRIVACAVAMTAILLSTGLFARTYSQGSVLLLVALYLPFVFAFRTEQKTYLKCLRFFSTLMLFFAGVVWAQHAIQFTVGWRWWPNLDLLLPKSLLIPQFNYIQPIRYGLDYMKPSGIFFLEVSTLSQFIALAVIIEIVFFQRWARVAFLGATLFATFAGTGTLLVVVAMPLLFVRMSTRTFIGALAAILATLFIAVQLHWFELTMNRVDEFGRTGTSANSRFIDPIYRLAKPLVSDAGLYSGIGAGQIESGGNTFWWPITKLSVEYGLIEAVIFYAFVIFCLLEGGMSRRFAFVLIIWYSFEGTLLTAYNPLTCVLLVTMFHVTSRKSVSRSADRGRRSDADRTLGSGLAST